LCATTAAKMAIGQATEPLLKTCQQEEERPKRCDIFKSFVKVSCAYMDVWFLRDTFGHDETLEKSLQEEVNMISQAFEVDPKWEEPSLIRNTFGLYLRYILAPSIKALDGYPCMVTGCGVLILGFLSAISIRGLMNLSAVPEDLGTFQKVEHLPIVPVVLLLCTHIIMMIFAYKQLCVLKNPDKCHLPFPLTYTIFVGKLFMVVRMVMAYSSGEMGTAINYFFWQELILTFMHSALSLLIGDPSPPRQDAESRDLSVVRNYSNQLKTVFLMIMAIDTFKTFVMYLYWVYFQPGWIATMFDRIPYMSSQVALSILIHAVLDMVQAAATMFTMFIGRFGRRFLS